MNALQTGSFDAVAVSGNARPGADYLAATAALDPIKPAVSAEPVEVKDKTATVGLQVAWPLGTKTWSYRTTATFRLVDQGWVLEWSPAIIHPELTAKNRLTRKAIAPERANIISRDGSALVERRDVQILGLDKQQLNGANPKVAAAQLAKLLKVNEQNFVKKVQAYGPKAFVEALVVRGTAANLPAGFASIPGARAVASTRILAPTATFAAGLIGAVQPADAAAVKAGKGQIVDGQPVGTSGLQKRYDERLRGTVGVKVLLSPREGEPADSAGDKEVFRAEPQAGKPLRLTLDENLQRKAEQILTGVKQPASIVAVDPKTGGIVVAANSPEATGNPFATTGRYPPGSTFKTVTSLAMIRQGIAPGSSLRCDNTIVVNGRQFKNYSDFPASATGTTTLLGAFANSCNTAFISMHGRLTPAELTQAAASLGMGTDYDAGFPVYYGSVPRPPNEVGKAESFIGQGLVAASPLSMAGVTASIAGGRTVVPYLVEGHQPKPTAAPLTVAEASHLQALMQSVVTDGSGRSLKGVVIGAKTGTAEYGPANPPKTHAWMIGYNKSLAAAVFVHDGKSGSQVAGPLLKAFLS